MIWSNRPGCEFRSGHERGQRNGKTPTQSRTGCLAGRQDSAHLFITTVTLGEVWSGFHRLEPEHPDYERIKIFASNLPRKYRVLNLDTRAAAIWGEMTAHATGPLPLRDSFIAAIVRSRGCRIVTRDEAPFERMGCKVVNPWFA